MKSRNLTIAMLALVIFLVGCSPNPADALSLEGTQWALVALNGVPPLAGTAASAEFSANQISGSAGCNQYFGTYEVSGSDITISDVTSTEMACMEPEGVMDQDRVFLTALVSVTSYRLAETRLELVDGTGNVILAFELPFAVAAVTAVLETPTSVPPALTVEPTEMPLLAFEPLAGFKLYQDSETGVSVYVPESWVVTGIIPGQFVILQSYPEDKYVGGEGWEPGDTKCDLAIRPPDVSVSDAIQTLRSDHMATILSEQEVVLLSGQSATLMEVDSLGPSMSLFAEVNERTVLLTCFGEFAQFDEIATTLGAAE